jgi:hypothetical protein
MGLQRGPVMLVLQVPEDGGHEIIDVFLLRHGVFCQDDIYDACTVERGMRWEVVVCSTMVSSRVCWLRMDEVVFVIHQCGTNFSILDF